MASEQTSAEMAAPAAVDGTDVESAPAGIPDEVATERALEAILMIADEPQSVVGLAAGIDPAIARRQLAVHHELGAVAVERGA